jgi:acetylornithine deacetylase/succinyl-diaminopimelate desuccinylase-like protein
MKKIFFLLPFLISLPIRADLEERKVPPEAVQETIQLIKDLVAINTTNPPGNELKVANYVKSILAKQKGIEVKVFQSAPGRGNLWARIKGNGSKPPFLITAHTDVVGANPADWQSDPFKVEERDGYLYGRGVLDDKGMGAAGIVIMKLLARNQVPLDRDVILFLGADEETNSVYGISWMLEHHPELVTADVVLNEGGRVYLEGDKITQVTVQNYEKLYMDVTLQAEGKSGHSSRPTQDNAVTRLANAVAKIGAYQFPVSLNEVTKGYFEGIAAPDHPLREDFLLITSGRSKGRKYQKAIDAVSQNPIYNAFLRTTCTPTVIKAGFKNNAIPGKTEANINCRVLPHEDPNQVIETLKTVIADPQVEVIPGEVDKPALSPVGPFFETVKTVAGEMAPGAVTIPLMSTGATESAKLRLRGIKAYGLVPFPYADEEATRMHGNDERLPVASIGFGVEFLYRLVVAFAGSEAN